ncbi:3-oxoadipate enol-lactonase [Devosia sp. Root685]|uniref:3-oxoadipate enol-lactonase n=1 Tax=Devosia sp. Root685 TaxID=1736587 RepID=UPI0006F6DACD|nr:3-oxoadipate enol-lactonase [Devosia sp. Root685]KRA96841.1 3-oxoadipate enol-lactonase [Devosia sp. Root685]
MNFARINGVLLHYRLAGPVGAPVVVLVNSLGTDARIWDGVISKLAGRYRVVSYDKRGHGLSDIPGGDYALEDHLDDLFGLTDHLGIERFALAGVSIGGLITQGAALRAPERLSALVICNSAAKSGDRAFWTARMEAVLSNGVASIADGIMERWFSPKFRAERTEELAGWRNMFLRCDVAGYAATCATLRDADLRDRIGAIRLPALLVAGEDDLAMPAAQVEATAKAIAGARFENFPGVGHIPSIEAPEKLADLMTEFFKEAGHG